MISVPFDPGPLSTLPVASLHPSRHLCFSGLTAPMRNLFTNQHYHHHDTGTEMLYPIFIRILLSALTVSFTRLLKQIHSHARHSLKPATRVAASNQCTMMMMFLLLTPWRRRPRRNGHINLRPRLLLGI